ncbi:MAG: glutaminyl-peptide cyclotransferase [Candidatus Roseilinea sp.]|nr:MAG: glutaminyl-peptide cyclotransferase [Candidatus Roseilinea sp.]
MGMRKGSVAGVWLVVAALAACTAPPSGPRSPAIPEPTAIPTAAVALTEQPLASPLLTPGPPAVITYTYTVVNAYPHDPGAFTQGLVYAGGVLYESTGLYGRSSLRRVALETGEVLQQRDLPAEYFGEGLALFDGQLIQLTWQNNTGFVYDAESFELQQTWAYPTEGWGLTHDGAHLIMSDGSATLRFLDPTTFKVQREVQVTDGGQLVVRLNELEYVNGEVFANIWQTDWVARIDPQTGRVLGWIDLSGLLTPEERQGVDVLNGIAYDAQNDRLFVTGKLWPKLFEITLAPKP